MAVRTASSFRTPTLLEMGESFRRTLLAENKSPKTVKAYMEAVRFFDRYLTAHPYLVDSVRSKLSPSRE